MREHWSKEQIDFMMSNYGTLNSREIGDMIGKSKGAVQKKAHRIGLSMTEEQKKTIFSKRGKEALGNFGEQFGCNNPNWKGGISKNNYHYKKLQKQRYPERVMAREKVYRAITNGQLTREPCEVCGDHNSQAHHKDYRKPLEVIWLCAKHHKERHI